MNLFARVVQAIQNAFAPRTPVSMLSQRTFEPCDHPLRETLDARYLAMRAAMGSRSAEAIAALLTDDFVSINVDGFSSGAKEMIKGVIDLDIDRSKRTPNTTIVSLQRAGDEVRLVQHYSMVSHDDAPKTMPKWVLALSEDVWRKVNGTWLLASTRTLEWETLTSRGHVYRHSIERGSLELRKESG